ncbi:hypothetical protein EKK58_05525 [Candidatus Dependentiae bacterium]|nr:MAG: hypothetical protein EKK58_05525 [Candidatus Dependentiae bacterium]
MSKPVESAEKRTIPLFDVPPVQGPNPIPVPPRKMLQLTLPIPGEQLVMPGCGEEDPAKLVRSQR